MGGGRKGAHSNEPCSLSVDAIEAAQHQAAARKTLQKKGAYVRLILRSTSDRTRRRTHFRRSLKIFDHAQDRLDDEARAPNSTGAPSLVRRRSLAVSLKGPNEITSLICAAGVTMAPSLAVA